MTRAGRPWLQACAGLGVAAVLVALVAAAWPGALARLEWQPGSAGSQPWRWWTAAWVHWSPLHLGMNLAGGALLALLGARAGLGARAVAAWALAWPLTHLGLLLQPQLLHYGGLSGLLHAGLAVVLVALWHSGPGRPRQVAVGLGLGLLVKLCSEAPWGAPVRPVPGWDFALAPLAHSTGAVAGLLAAGLLLRPPARLAHPPAGAP